MRTVSKPASRRLQRQSFLTGLKPRKQAMIAAAVLGALTSAVNSYAASVYWDVNGTTPDSSGGTTAAGTWGAATNWNTDPAGGAGTLTTEVGAGNTAVF